MRHLSPPRRTARLFGACAAAFASLFALAGCGAAGDLIDSIDGSSGGGGASTDELESRREDWEELEIDSYRFVVVYDRDDRPSVTLEAAVRGGAIDEAVAYETEDPDDELSADELDELTDRFGTIPRVFATVKTAIADEDRDVEAEYDGSYHYPEEVEVTSDDEDEERYTLRITDFARSY